MNEEKEGRERRREGGIERGVTEHREEGGKDRR